METCLQKTGKLTEPGGFVLLEVVPALTVLLVVLIASMRLAWTAMEHNRALAAASWRERILPVVWETWKREASDVVVAHETDNGLEVRYFPDISWLPLDSREGGDAYTLMLVREPADLAGRPAWRISRLLPVADGEARPQAHLMVLQEASPDAGEGTP